MALKIDVPESMVESTKKLYREEAKTVLRERAAANKRWDDLKPILRQLGILSEYENDVTPVKQVATSQPLPSVTQYDKNLSWLKKAYFAIHQNGAMSALEIIDYIKSKWETDLPEDTAKNSLPATLSVAAKDGKILRTKKENGEFVYDLIK